MIHHIWEDVKPDGASDSTFAKMMVMAMDLKINGCISNFKGFLKLDPTSLEDENHYDKLIILFLINWKTFECRIRDIIKYANIPLLGRTIGQRIESQISSVEEFVKFVETEFPTNIFKHGVLNDYILNLQTVLDIIDKEKIVLESENNKNYIRVAVTGKLSLPRNKWFDKYAVFGVEKAGVTADTFCLVTNDTSTGSNTLKKAQKLGLMIYSEEQFNDFLRSKNCEL